MTAAVIKGRYKGAIGFATYTKATLIRGLKRIKLNSETVKATKVLGEGYRKGNKAGGQKQRMQVQIEWRDSDEKSLLDCDEQFYNAVNAACFE